MRTHVYDNDAANDVPIVHYTAADGLPSPSSSKDEESEHEYEYHQVIKFVSGCVVDIVDVPEFVVIGQTAAWRPTLQPAPRARMPRLGYRLSARSSEVKMFVGVCGLCVTQ